MAQPVFDRSRGDGDGSIIIVTWNLTTADPSGVGVQLPEWADVNFTMTSGAWGGAVGAVEGSNDGATYIGVSNAAGGAAWTTSAANKVGTVIERTLFVRPNLTTPGAGAVVTAIAVFRRAQPIRV